MVKFGKVLNKRSGDVSLLNQAAFVAKKVKDQVKADFGPNAVQTPEVKRKSIDLVLGRMLMDVPCSVATAQPNV